MQQRARRRSNPERTARTRAALIAAARALFVTKGYAETGTPEIVAAAEVTRGALYHHFDDKADLFLAVARQAAEEVAAEIAHRTRRSKRPLAALGRGSDAYFAAMSEGGRARLLLLEAPSILGAAQLRELGDLAGAAELREGLEAALLVDSDVSLEALTQLVSAAFDRAALAIAQGGSAKAYRAAIHTLLERLVAGD